MSKPLDHNAVSDEDVSSILLACVERINKADGDRDYMNPSNLTVQDTTAIADLLGLAAAKLKRAEARK